MAAEDRQPTLLKHVDPASVGMVEDLFRTAARRIRARLVNRSGTDVLVRFGSAELGSLGQSLDRLRGREGGAYIRFRLSPGDVPCLVTVDGRLLYRLVGMVLGEKSANNTAVQRWRLPTALDLRICRRLVEDALDGLMEVTPPGVSAHVTVESISANPRVPMDLPRTMTVVESSLDFGPPEDAWGLMTFVLPAAFARELWPKRVSRPEDTNSRAGIERVLPVPVTLVAELARIKTSLSKLRAIRPGDTIDLGSARDIELTVGGRSTLLGEPGTSGAARSVRIKNRTDQSGSPQR